MFAKRIRENRINAGLSVEELSKLLKVDIETYKKWESGLSLPNIDTVIKLSELFDVSTDYLLKDRKSESGFSYYTTFKEEKREIHKYKLISISFILISLICMLTLLTISLLEPIYFTNIENGKTYQGFWAYYYTYSEFMTVAIFSSLVFIGALIYTLIPERKLRKKIQKKK